MLYAMQCSTRCTHHVPAYLTCKCGSSPPPLRPPAYLAPPAVGRHPTDTHTRRVKNTIYPRGTDPMATILDSSLGAGTGAGASVHRLLRLLGNPHPVSVCDVSLPHSRCRRMMWAQSPCRGAWLTPVLVGCGGRNLVHPHVCGILAALLLLSADLPIASPYAQLAHFVLTCDCLLVTQREFTP